MDLERRSPVGLTRYTPVVGFALLGTASTVLAAFGIVGAVAIGGPFLGLLLVLVAGGVGLGILYEWRFVHRFVRQHTAASREHLTVALPILGGTLFTYGGVQELGLSPIVAAGLVGIGAAFLVPGSAVPVYCGAFVGMTSPALFSTYWHALASGVVASGVFYIAQPVFFGVGGKLGTTAFVGVVTVVVATTGTFHHPPLPDVATLGLLLGYAMVGAVVTYALHTRTRANAVLASATVGVVGGLALPILHGTGGPLVAAAVFSASFAGMAQPRRIPGEGWMAVTGLLVGILVVATTPVIGGSGGKLGTIAFGSCIAVHGFLRRFHVIRARPRIERVPPRDTT